MAAQPGWQISGEVVIRLRRPHRSKTAALYLRGLARMNRRKPAVRIGPRAVDDPEELLLQLLGDRTASSLTDRDAIDRPDRGDLRGRPREEDFVGDIQHLARNDRLHHWNVEFARQGQDAISRDSGQN